MLYNEEEVLNICKKYGIETEVMEGHPTYMGVEMDDNFSIAKIMNESVKYVDNSVICITETVKLTLPVFVDDSSVSCSTHLSIGKNTLNYKKESIEQESLSSIPCDNENKFAA